MHVLPEIKNNERENLVKIVKVLLTFIFLLDDFFCFSTDYYDYLSETLLHFSLKLRWKKTTAIDF